MSLRNKPLFITFEGGEGSGKTTLIEGLYEALKKKGRSIVKTREPGGTALGEQIRTLLLHEAQTQIGAMSELLLFLSSRAQHIEEFIEPHLEDGYIVLCDRFNDSSIAYQGIARGLGLELAEGLAELACRGLKPDITFILDLDPKRGMKRIEKMHKEWDRLEELKLSFHQKVHQGYKLLAEREPKRVHLIDATLSIEEVFNQAWSFLEAIL